MPAPIDSSLFTPWSELPPEATKVIHFLWGFLGDKGPVPAKFALMLKLWKRYNPGFALVLHDLDQATELVQQHFPDYIELFQGYQRPIQRCDIFRYMLLYLRGGCYADLDVKPFCALDEFKAQYPQAKAIFCVESILSEAQEQATAVQYPIRQGCPEKRIRIANYLLISEKQHPIWLDILELARQRAHLAVKEPYDVLYTTGPDIVTEAVHAAEHIYKDIAVLPPDEGNRFALHYAASTSSEGSWRF